jgi:hypothetical protein
VRSTIVHRGNRLCLEITLDTTGVDRAEVARAMLAAHGLRDGQCEHNGGAGCLRIQSRRRKTEPR